VVSRLGVLGRPGELNRRVLVGLPVVLRQLVMSVLPISPSLRLPSPGLRTILFRP
jgi:hypothetical protein